jgi:hypothetical protein
MREAISGDQSCSVVMVSRNIGCKEWHSDGILRWHTQMALRGHSEGMPVGNGGLLGAFVSSSAARCSAEPSSAQWAPAAARIVSVACSNAAWLTRSLAKLGSFSVARRSSS